MSKLNLEEVVLGNYGGIKLKAAVEEKEDDIVAAILYVDHGDEFLRIVIQDCSYEYGWWLNRRPYPDYDDLLAGAGYFDAYYHDQFIRLPKLNGKFDKNSGVSNEIYHAEKYLEEEKRFDFFSKEFEIIRPSNPTGNPQYDFNIFFSKMEDIYNEGTIYHRDIGNVNVVRYFLSKNNILTDENVEKLEKLKTYYRVDAIDGVAGKRKFDRDDYVYGDSIEWIYYNGEIVKKKFNKHKIKVKSTREDEWGVSRFYLSLEQFK